MTNIIKVGTLPGILKDVAVDETTSIAQAIEFAGFTTEGFEVKADSRTVSDLNAPATSANTILLVKKVKGNSGVIKVGTLPGILKDVAVDGTVTVAQAIELAGFTTEGFEVKGDSRTISDLDAVASNYNTILLVKKVKGNAGQVKVGTLPGILKDVAVDDSTTVAQAIEFAGFTTDGFEVKGDSRTITDLDGAASSYNTILLVKKVKGNVIKF